MTTAIPCRAKDPNTCPFHGAQLRAEMALLNNDIDAYMKAQEEMFDARDIDEVETFRRELLGAPENSEEPDGEGVPIKILDVSGMSLAEKTTYLEERVLLEDSGFPNSFYRSKSSLNEAIMTVAKYTPQDTIYDIAYHESEYSPERFFEAQYGQDAIQVVKAWQDFDHLKKQDLLAGPKSNGWEDQVQYRLANLLFEYGEVMSDNESVYGWHDYDYHLDKTKRNVKPVAILSVKEDYWSQFQDTFTGNSDHVGISGVALMSDNTVKKLRYENDPGAMIRKVRQQFQKK